MPKNASKKEKEIFGGMLHAYATKLGINQIEFRDLLIMNMPGWSGDITGEELGTIATQLGYETVKEMQAAAIKHVGGSQGTVSKKLQEYLPSRITIEDFRVQFGLYPPAVVPSATKVKEWLKGTATPDGSQLTAIAQILELGSSEALLNSDWADAFEVFLPATILDRLEQRNLPRNVRQPIFKIFGEFANPTVGSCNQWFQGNSMASEKYVDTIAHMLGYDSGDDMRYKVLVQSQELVRATTPAPEPIPVKIDLDAALEELEPDKVEEYAERLMGRLPLERLQTIARRLFLRGADRPKEMAIALLDS